MRSFADYPLAELIERIDWTPFFQTWELPGHFPDILSDPVTQAAALPLYHDAQALLERIAREERLTAHGVVGFWPANAVDDDIALYLDEARTASRAVIHTLRQQMAKAAGRFNLALADFVRPLESGQRDYLGAFTVTAGHGLDLLVE